MSFPQERVVSFEVSEGKGPRVLEGAAYGAGVGVGVAVLFLTQFCGGDTHCGSGEVGRAVAVFAPPFALGGALIGTTARVERWRPLRRRDHRWVLAFSVPAPWSGR